MSSRKAGPSSHTSCSTVPTRCTATLPSRAQSCVTRRRLSTRSASAISFASWCRSVRSGSRRAGERTRFSEYYESHATRKAREDG